MANPPKPWKAEYAKSARSSCKTCRRWIGMEVFRLGKMVRATQFDGFMPRWNHAKCILKKRNQIKFADDVEGIESLRWEDQQSIRNYVEAGKAVTPIVIEYAIEVSQTSRATCKQCSQKIMNEEVRISSKLKGKKSKVVWNHAKCFMELSPTTQVEKLPGWEKLSSSDQETVYALVKELPAANNDKETEVPEEKKTQLTGKKRKRDDCDGKKSKATKLEGDVPTSRAESTENESDLLDKKAKDSDLDSKMRSE